MSSHAPRMIERWFPCDAVNKSVATPEGSGRSEQAIFTWFAARPVAQARAAVLTTLLPDDERLRPLVEKAVLKGDAPTLSRLADLIRREFTGNRPVLLDPFSGRGMIPLEAARLGLTSAGFDYSSVAVLASRLLADFPFRQWDEEPSLPFSGPDVARSELSSEPRLLADVRMLLKEVGDRVRKAVGPFYPTNSDGAFPWGYLWAVTIPCDACARRFPLVGSLVLRHPYKRSEDAGQSLRIVTDGDRWYTEVLDGPPTQPATFSSEDRRGKSARCPFCQHIHSLDNVKSKGWAGQYQDEPLLAADIRGDTRKVFRKLRTAEIEAVRRASEFVPEGFGRRSAIPDEMIPRGNEDTVRASGYGYRTYGQLMNHRQALQFVETARAIRCCHHEMVGAGLSGEYAATLACYAAANLVRRIRRATRGAKLLSHGDSEGSEQNRVQVDHIFADESKVSFQFDYFETGPGIGPGTWDSVAETGLQSLARHLRSLTGKPGRFRQASAMAIPVRDGTIDAVVTDPAYYNMIDYCDASDLFYVWLKRALFDIVPDLFAHDGLQDKTEEIIVKRGGSNKQDHRTREFYESSLSQAFGEIRRVLRPDGTLVVVFGHSDPDAWVRLIKALQDAGFVVTSTWPARTESANTGVASIRVTVTIGCRIAPANRPVATAAQVDREVADVIRQRVAQWGREGLSFGDQVMAAYGPAMEVYGRYSRILQPDAGESQAPIERYISAASAAVRDAVAMRIDTMPLDTFDPLTRFAVFWMRLYGRSVVNKSEARFLAQADNLRLDSVRDGLLLESKAGYRLTLDSPSRPISSSTPTFDVVRAMASAWGSGGSDAVGRVLADAQRAADDPHIWAVVGELARLLPQSDRDSRAFNGIQRSTDSVQRTARGLEATIRERPVQQELFPDLERRIR